MLSCNCLHLLCQSRSNPRNPKYSLIIHSVRSYTACWLSRRSSFLQRRLIWLPDLCSHVDLRYAALHGLAHVVRLDARSAMENQWDAGHTVQLFQSIQIQARFDFLLIFAAGGNRAVNVANCHREPVAFRFAHKPPGLAHIGKALSGSVQFFVRRQRPASWPNTAPSSASTGISAACASSTTCRVALMFSSSGSREPSIISDS